ncbi:tripartite tricarboxylate transporter permease [Pararhizobium sp. IMCC21322]|uniref:tripartite tricarboxylate transporter permease n=1 Tax=Pararhizobium sp. IMCC21322 TaxID=3067903 RepID=UPI0027410842|nr:tripartite tricarboxylate transporter permease [Pararhizobium sp. IMCC21322]
MSGLGFFLDALGGFLTSPMTLFNVAWATFLGILVGSLPGLTATLGIALLTTLTFRMDGTQAILILICMYVGAIYGGSRSAILLNIPGTPANAATALDGFPLARAGKAGKAMGIATAGSFAGGMIGMLALALVAPVLGDFALSFGSYEFFWLALFGVLISGQITTTGDALKGWIAGFIGLFVAMIGQEGIHSYQRFSYGSSDLSGGIGLLPALVGAFGFAEILTVMKARGFQSVRDASDRILPRMADIWRYKRTIVRSGLIGTFMGLLPGVGEDMGAWMSYAAAKRASKVKETFGKGSLDGLMAAETGNNAAVPGAIIPVLTLAVPGSAPAAVLLAAMFIHGIRPGPMIMIEFPSFVFEVVAMVAMAMFAMLIIGLLLTRPLLMVLAVPRAYLMPLIFTLCTIGSFAIAGRIFDIYVMLAFGLIGFALREMKYPMAPLVLGIVLGDLLDKSFRRGMTLSDGDFVAFLTRPISAFLALACVLMLLGAIPPVRRRVTALLGSLRKKPSETKQ